ncbi:MAG TPA: hypothetical protein VGQ83_36410 [Polyangia bacterium]
MVLALVGAIAVVALMHAINPWQEPGARVADTKQYLQMAEQGVGGARFSSPFAYRIGFIALGGATARMLGVSRDHGFAAMALVGLPLFLVLLYLLGRDLTRSRLHAGIAVLLVGISFSVGKRLCYNPIDPDTLGLPLTALASLLALRRRYGWLTLVTCVGVLGREFVVVPAVAAALTEWRAGALSWRDRRSWWPLAAVAGALLIALGLRLAVPVARSTMMVDPFHRETWRNAISLLNSRWIANDAGAIAAFLLPVLCLWHVERAGRRVAAMPRWAVHYALVLFAVTLVAGSDFTRFAAYFAPLLVILYVLEAADEPVWLQVVLVVLILGANRIAEPIPPPNKDHWRYIGFAAFYTHHMDVYTATRVVELIGTVAVYRALRSVSRWWRRDTSPLGG